MESGPENFTVPGAAFCYNLWLWAFTKYVNQDGLLRSIDRADLAKAIRESLDERYSAEQVVEALISESVIKNVTALIPLKETAVMKASIERPVPSLL